MKASQTPYMVSLKPGLRRFFVFLLCILPFWASCETYGASDQKSELVIAFTDDENMRICRGVGLINGVVLALIQLEEYGCELWRIDPGGAHEIFADINAHKTGSDISYDFGYGPMLQGWYYFGADDEVNENRLWRTNGVTLSGFRKMNRCQVDLSIRVYPFTRLVLKTEIILRPSR